MVKTNLDIIEVKTYCEKARISSVSVPFKVAVIKVKYSNGSWETIFRTVLNHSSLKINDICLMEQYKSLNLNQIREISYILNENDQKVFELYLKHYLKCDLNINAFIEKASLRHYLQVKVNEIMSKTKNAFHQASLNLKKVRVYGINSKNVTNI